MSVLVLILGLICANSAFSSDDGEARDRGWCDTRYESLGEWSRSEANLDLYNGLAFFSAGGLISELGQPTRQWSAFNALDDETRSRFRLETAGARRRADLASDVTLAVGLAVLPIATIGAQWARTRDCVETWDMTTDFVESFGLTLMITETIKLASGRARPFVRSCGPGAPSDATCNGDDRYRSFVSGHAALSATGAGVTCAFSIKRHAWGSSRTARYAPCVAGIGLAVSTGALRLSADRHWLTDVAGGLLIGGAVGWFDTWGPFDALRFESRDAGGRLTSLGVLLPANVEGHPGLRFSMVY